MPGTCLSRDWVLQGTLVVMLDSSAGSDPCVEGRCSVLGRSEKCPQSAISSLLSSTAGLQQFRHSWRQGLELQYTASRLSSVSRD